MLDIHLLVYLCYTPGYWYITTHLFVETTTERMTNGHQVVSGVQTVFVTDIYSLGQITVKSVLSKTTCMREHSIQKNFTTGEGGLYRQTHPCCQTGCC